MRMPAQGPLLDGSDPARLLLSLTSPGGLVLRTSVPLDVGTRFTVGVKLSSTKEVLPVEVVVVGSGTPAQWPTVRVRLAPEGGPGVRVLTALAQAATWKVSRSPATRARLREAIVVDNAALATELSRAAHGGVARLVLDRPVEDGLTFDCVVGTRRWPALVRFKAESDGREPGPDGERHLVKPVDEAGRRALLRFLLRLGVTVDRAATKRAV